MYKEITFLFQELKYSGHLQSLGASSIVFTAATVLNQELSLSLLLTPYLLFQAIYFYDRYRDLNIDQQTNKERTLHLKHYAPLIPAVIIIILTATGALLVLFATNTTVIFASVVAVLGFLYPILFKRVTQRIPLFKNIFVAAVFALMIFFPSLYWQGTVSTNVTVISLASLVFIEAFIMQVILDLKDKASDKKQNLRTLPVLLSQGKTLITLVLISVLTLTLAFTLNFPNQVIRLATASFLINVFALWQIVHHNKRGFIWEASKFLFWPIILAVI